MANQKDMDKQEQSQEKKPQVPNMKVKKVVVNMNINPKRMILWFLIALLFLPFFISLLSGNSTNTIPLTQVITDVRDRKIDRIDVNGQDLDVQYKDGQQKVSRIESQQNLVAVFKDAGVDPTNTTIQVKNQGAGKIALDILINVLPLVLMVAFFFFIFRQARGAQDGILGFGKSKAKIFNKGKQNIKFSDVGGVKEAKQELEEIVDFLKHPKKYQAVGARTPKGALLVGPSGTGKTLLARAVAGEAGVPFLSMAGSEFMEMLVGVGASRARDLFETAKKVAPSIIFIDEIDAIGRMRGFGAMGGHDEREQTLNQILVEMDGFTPNDAVVVLAATNRGDLLDPALTRPGRFDRRVTLDLPDIEERKYIVSIHAKNKPFEEGIDWDKIARRTVGFSGADLESMLNEAAILIAREDRKKITYKDLEEAATKVKLGPEKKRLQSNYERKMTAYHEAGHAILAHVLPHTDAVHRISIISRGRALGYTMTPPETDKYQQTKSELEESIIVFLGGRTAEKLVFNELTGGASSDIDRATRIARTMVIDYGMSTLGPITLSPQYEISDYGKAMMEPTKLSDAMQAKVDDEITSMMEKASALAIKLVTKYRKQLDAVADKLLDIETLEGDEFEKIVGMKKVKAKEA